MNMLKKVILLLYAYSLARRGISRVDIIANTSSLTNIILIAILVLRTLVNCLVLVPNRLSGVGMNYLLLVGV